MELNDEAAGDRRDTAEPSTADIRERAEDDDKTTAVAAAPAAPVGVDRDAAIFVRISAIPYEEPQPRVGGGRATAETDEDDKATVTEAAAAAVADEQGTGLASPFGQLMLNEDPSPLPLGPWKTRSVIMPCVNLHEMREARTVFPTCADDKWQHHGGGVDVDRTVTAITATTITTTTAMAPASTSEGSSTSTSTAVPPNLQLKCSSKPAVIPLHQYEPESLPSIPYIPESIKWDLTIYENRLKTYRNKWLLPYLTPRQMAKAGFYFLGIKDNVKCVFCSKEFHYWERDDDPFTKHKLFSPDCQYLNQHFVYDVCGHFENLLGHCIPGNEINMIHYFLKTVGIVHQVKVLRHNKKFTSYDSRYKTFHESRSIINSNIDTLCKAGYYSTGITDETICFCCNQGLKEWEKHDDPWVEHARWSPTCSFVLLSKGKHFVEEVGGEVNYNLNVDMEELCKLITIHKNTSKNVKTLSSATERILKHSSKTMEMTEYISPDFNHNIIQQHPNTLPDSMLCKICYKEKLEVLLMPCGHIISCIQCAVTIEQCAICRLPFALSLRVFIYPTGRTISDDDETFYPESVLKNVEAVPCKVCCQEDIELVFLPCRHACTCFSCGEKMKECPVCFEMLYAFIKVFL